MSRERFEETEKKLAPSDSVIQALFDKAQTLGAGEKYLGDAEETFLARGIAPQTADDSAEPLAQVKSSRAVIIAAAAVLALALGVGVFFGITQSGRLATVGSRTQQTEEESKTDISIIKIPESEKEGKAPQEWLSEKIKETYAQYIEAGSDPEKLSELKGFRELVGYSDRMYLYIYSMILNGELEGGYLSLAVNAASVSRELWYGGGRLDTLSAVEYFSEYTKNTNALDPSTFNYEEEKPLYETAAGLIKEIHQNSADSSKRKIDLKRLIRESFGEYDNGSALFCRLYYFGLIETDELDTAFGTVKELNDSKQDITTYFSMDMSYRIDYYDTLLDDPHQHMYDESETEAWVCIALDRISENIAGQGYDILKDKNYLTIKNLGAYTAQRAMISLYLKGELGGEREVAANKVMNLLFGGGQNYEQQTEPLIRLAASLGANADCVTGCCDGNYRSSSDIEYNRTALDKLYAALSDSELCELLYSGGETDESTYALRENAYAYMCLYDFSSDSLFSEIPNKQSLRLEIIIPDKESNEVIINGVICPLTSEQLAGVLEAVKAAIPPYGEKAQAPDLMGSAAITLSGSATVFKEEPYRMEELLAAAEYISEHSLPSVRKNEGSDDTPGLSITLNGSDTPYIEAYEAGDIYIGGSAHAAADETAENVLRRVVADPAYGGDEGESNYENEIM